MSSEDRVVGGSTSTYFTTYAISASCSRSATPSARATDSTSRTAPRNCSRITGSAHSGPIGRRAAPVKAANGAR